VSGNAREKRLAFKGLNAGTAVPTGEAHRLPKKCAFLSVQAREVKASRPKIQGNRVKELVTKD